MAFQKLAEGFTYSAPAGADLSTSQNFAAKVDSSGNIVLAGDNDKILGAIFEAGALNAPVSVYWASICKFKAGAAIAKGARVACGANGKVKTSSGTNPIGIALDAAAGDGSVVSVAMVG